MSTSNIPAFQYTPGDRHRYVWDGDQTIIVQRIVRTGLVTMYVATGDTIPAPDKRTAQAMADAVNQWREARS